MAEVKFKKTTSTNLDSVPVSDGQIVAVTDTGELHIDFDNARTKYSGGSQVDLSKNSVRIGEETTSSTDSVVVGYGASTAYSGGVAVGKKATVISQYGLALGNQAKVDTNADFAISIGDKAKATHEGAIQLGFGNSKENYSFSVGLGATDNENHLLLRSDGFIPDERLSGNISRSDHTHDVYALKSEIPTDYLTEDDLRGTGENSVSLCTDGAVVSGEQAIAIGRGASATKLKAIQIGPGANYNANTFQVFNTTLLDADGKIPDERLSDNIARAGNCITQDAVYIDTMANILALKDTESADFNTLYYAKDEGVFYRYTYICDKEDGTPWNRFIAINRTSTLYVDYATNGDIPLSNISKVVNVVNSVPSIAYIADGSKEYLHFNNEYGTGNYNVYTSDTVDDLLQNYAELDSSGKISVECIPDGVGGSSWKWEELEDTALESLVLDNIVTVFKNDLVSADFSSISVDGEILYTGQSVLHFHSGTTATAVTCGNVKFIGLHCYAGTFTPQKNTYYTVTLYYNGGQYVGSVGGYAG